MKRTLILAAIATAVAGQVQARDYISIVGSSTVYPFATVVAERFGKTTDFKTPKIESTGSGGGPQAVLRRRRRRAPRRDQRLAAHQGERGREVRRQWRDRRRRGQDRLRRDRIRELPEVRARRNLPQADLPRTREGRAGPERRRDPGPESVHEVERCRRFAARLEDRSPRPAADLRHAGTPSPSSPWKAAARRSAGSRR